MENYPFYILMNVKALTLLHDTGTCMIHSNSYMTLLKY